MGRCSLLNAALCDRIKKGTNNAPKYMFKMLGVNIG